MADTHARRGASGVRLPEIQSIGLPPEKHADRIVADMLRVVAAAHKEVWPKVTAIISENPDGSPKAQQKMYDRMAAAANPFVIAGYIETGKRGRYKIAFLRLDVWDAETTNIVGPDDPIPATPWLTFTTVRITGKGDHQYDYKTTRSLFVTHHALSRLAQRCGARKIGDLIGAAHAIGDHYHGEYSQTQAGKMDHDYHRMRVELRNGTTVICPMTRYKDGKGGLVLVTLYKDGEEETA